MDCYLCGTEIVGDVSRDHVPPQQVFAPDIRRKFNVDRLTTLSTHPSCNSSFKLDEEYAIRVLATAVYDSPTAKAVVENGFAKANRGQGIGLHRKILNSMEGRPSGLFLPGDRALMRLDAPRIERVVWKIVRGLHYLDHGTVLPDSLARVVELDEPANDSQSDFADLWNAVRGQPSQGPYQAIFAHKYFRAEKEGLILHGWGMLLWDRIIVYCAHLDPGVDPLLFPPRLGPATA